MQVGYHYNVLTEKGNKKFARKEEKNHISLVALKVTNNTDRPLTYGKDMQLYSGAMPISIMDQEIVFKSLRQQAPLFLLYLMLLPTNLTISPESTNGGMPDATVIPVGYALGPGLAIGNMMMASSNNKVFRTELSMYDLTDRQIAPGETVYGLVGLSFASFSQLEMRVNPTQEPVYANDDEYYREN